MSRLRHLARAAAASAFVIVLAPTLWAQVGEAEYAARRAALTSKLGDGVYLVLGAAAPKENYDNFWQAQNFRYLTGFLEPGAALVIVRKDGRDRPMLFVEPRDPAQEVWTGERLGVAGVKAKTAMEGRDAATTRSVLDSVLAPGLPLFAVGDLSGIGGADVPVSRSPRTVDDQFLDALRERHRGIVITDASRDVMKLRGRKSPAELGLIRMAAKVSAAAHKEVLANIRPGMNEFEVQALAEYTFRRNGGDRPSYGSIVGSGPNSTTLHYNRDDRFMNAGEVLNMDMATYYGGYSADITRTVPVSRTFSAGIYVRANTVDIVPDTPANATFRSKIASAVRQYANIGVRIEDDYIATPAGFERTSADAPREIDDIEREMARNATTTARDGATVEAYKKIRP